MKPVFCLCLALAAGCTDRALEIPIDGGSDRGSDMAPVSPLSCRIGAPPSTLPEQMSGSVATSGPDGRIYLFEGDEAAPPYMTRTFAYDLHAGTYEDLPEHNWAAALPSGAYVLGQQLVIVWGSFFVFDLPSLTWTSILPGPPQLTDTHFALARSPDGRLYAAYFNPDDLDVSPHLAAVSDPAGQTWTPLPVLPLNTDTDVIGAFAGGRFWVLGEQDFVYDPSSSRWSELAPAATPHVYAAVAVIGDLIYVAGGATADDGAAPPTAALDVLDPATRVWSSRAPMPLAVTAAAAAVGCDGRLYVFGGSTEHGPFEPPFTDVTQVYDPATDSWQVSP